MPATTITFDLSFLGNPTDIPNLAIRQIRLLGLALLQGMSREILNRIGRLSPAPG